MLYFSPCGSSGFQSASLLAKAQAVLLQRKSPAALPAASWLLVHKRLPRLFRTGATTPARGVTSTARVFSMKYQSLSDSGAGPGESPVLTSRSVPSNVGNGWRLSHAKRQPGSGRLARTPAVRAMHAGHLLRQNRTSRATGANRKCKEWRGAIPARVRRLASTGKSRLEPMAPSKAVLAPSGRETVPLWAPSHALPSSLAI